MTLQEKLAKHLFDGDYGARLLIFGFGAEATWETATPVQREGYMKRAMKIMEIVDESE